MLVDLDARCGAPRPDRPPPGERPELYGGGRAGRAGPRRTRSYTPRHEDRGHRARLRRAAARGRVLRGGPRGRRRGHRPARASRRCRAGISDIEDIPSERAPGASPEASIPRRATPTSRRSSRRHRRAHAALAQPRAGPRAARSPPDARSPSVLQAGSARRARVDHLPGHHARAARAAARGVGPRRRARLQRRLLARSGSTRAGPTTRCGTRRRSSAASPTTCLERALDALRRGLRPARGGLDAGGRGAHQAAREHLPLGEHRARQRARDAVRPDGNRHLGGRGRRRDQAVRLHALRARGPGWAATACRWTRSTSPGARASSTCRPSSSSSPARSTSAMPYFCVEKIARALNDHSKAVRGSRSLIIGVSYKAGRGRPARVARAARSSACSASAAPRSSTTTRTCRSCPSTTCRAARVASRTCDCAVIVTAHPGLDFERVVREAPLVVDFRGVTRGTRPRTSCVCDALRIGVVGLGYWGPNLARNFDRLPGAELALALRRVQEALERWGASFPGAHDDRRRGRPAGGRLARRRRRGHPGPDPRRAGAAGARAGQALLRREAARRSAPRRSRSPPRPRAPAGCSWSATCSSTTRA